MAHLPKSDGKIALQKKSLPSDLDRYVAARSSATYPWSTHGPLSFEGLSSLRILAGAPRVSLSVRYSTACLAISADRLARRPPAKTRDGRREAAPPCFVDEGGVLLSDLRSIAKHDVEIRRVTNV